MPPRLEDGVCQVINTKNPENGTWFCAVFRESHAPSTCCNTLPPPFFCVCVDMQLRRREGDCYKGLHFIVISYTSKMEIIVARYIPFLSHFCIILMCYFNCWMDYLPLNVKQTTINLSSNQIMTMIFINVFITTCVFFLILTSLCRSLMDRLFYFQKAEHSSYP